MEGEKKQEHRTAYWELKSTRERKKEREAAKTKKAEHQLHTYPHSLNLHRHQNGFGAKC